MEYYEQVLNESAPRVTAIRPKFASQEDRDRNFKVVNSNYWAVVWNYFQRLPYDKAMEVISKYLGT